MKVINKGVFKPIYNDKYYIVGLHPVDFDISYRELWLTKIQHISSHMVGSGNYSTDYKENWNLIFKVNSGIGEGKAYKSSEDYFVVLEIEIYTWYRSKEDVAIEINDGLKSFPIINKEEVINAFAQRNYYRRAELIKL